MAPSQARSIAPSRASTSNSITQSHPNSKASTSKQTTSQQSATQTSSAGERYTVAVHEQRGVGREIGLAMFHQDIAKVILTQFSDTASCFKALHLFNSRRPGVLIVLPSAAGVSSPNQHSTQIKPTDKSTLVKGVEEAFPDCQIVPLHRKNYNELAGWTFVNNLIIKDDERSATLTPLKKKAYALSAASALFKYLESQRTWFPNDTLRIVYHPLEGTCLIDQDTIKYLELVTNFTNKKSKQSLLGALNQTITPSGLRLLRSTILSPLTDTVELNKRLEAVFELKNNEAGLTTLRKALEPLKTIDLEKLAASIATYDKDTLFFSAGRTNKQLAELDPALESERNLTKAFQLRQFMMAVPGLKAALDKMESVTLTNACARLDKAELGEILLELTETLNPEVMAQATDGRKAQASARNAKIYAVKVEKDPALDVARETWQENFRDLATLAEELQTKHKMQLDFSWSPSGGAVLRANKDDIPSQGIPKIFTNIVNRGVKQIEFSCIQVKQRSAKLKAAMDAVVIQSNQVLQKLFSSARSVIGVLYQAAEAIAIVDVMASFADIANRNDYIRPQFGSTLAIKAGRHILHERFRAVDGAFQPNDTFASDACSFQILTGPNMSGKSVFLRQVCLLHILAQIGSFVPAGFCMIKVCDTILSRLGNDDSIEDNLSTFGKEMATMAMILSTLSTTQHALVIVDELGRGTSPEEGAGIAHAISARLIRSKATCFFATHFKELPTTLSQYPNVVTYHLHAETDRAKSDFSMVFSHKVVPGVTPMAHYGLELVKAAKLPADVLLKAVVVSSELDQMESAGKKRLATNTVVKRRKALLELRAGLRELSHCDHLTPTEIHERMQMLQNDLVYALSATLDIEKNVEHGPTVTEVIDGEERGEEAKPNIEGGGEGEGDEAYEVGDIEMVKEGDVDEAGLQVEED